jgi:DNA repair exonuclease SbcCD ATPase subunit
MSDPVTAETKLRLEAEKLQAEIDNLRRPWIKNPASWVSLITIFVALCGLGFQYVNHQAAAAAARREVGQAKDELKQSEDRLAEVQAALSSKEPLLAQVSTQLDQATSELLKLMDERQKATSELQDLDKKLAELQMQLAALPNTPQNRSAQNVVAQAGRSVKALQTANVQSLEKANVLNRNLNIIKASPLVRK